jgi:uncharacterized membrane protein YkoI
MKMKILFAAAAAALIAAPAWADRAPTAAERSAIEAKVRAAGYVSWEEIELDDDGPHWEVDDARKRDGKRYDLKLQVRTLKIVRQSLDD